MTKQELADYACIVAITFFGLTILGPAIYASYASLNLYGWIVGATAIPFLIGNGFFVYALWLSPSEKLRKISFWADLLAFVIGGALALAAVQLA